MPQVTYTEEQTAALTTWNSSVALAAGAGCGKTFVLTRRFLSHLDPLSEAPDVELGEIVAITFTDAAARELRDRVRKTCLERLHDPANPDPDRWLKLLRSLDSARISTIHSLCGKLIRSHAVELGLDPTFRISDGAASWVMQIEVVDGVLRDRLAARDPAVMQLAADYGLMQLKIMIGELLPKARLPEFSAWLDKTPETAVAIWNVALVEQVIPESLGNLSQSSPANDLVRLLLDLPYDSSLKPTLAEARAYLLDRVPRLAEFAEDPDELRNIREAAKVQGVCTKKDWPDEESYREYSAACKAFRDELDKVLKLAFDPATAEIAATNGLNLLQVTAEVAEAYEQAKRNQAALDYDDLLFHAHRLLNDDRFLETRRQWQKQIRLLFVDEFQDTDQLQVDIVKALVGDGLASGGLFFVGDSKQSIYRFRGAEPQVFRSLTQEIPAAGRLLLTTNFRSQPAILDFVNALFSRAFEAEYQPLRAKRPQITERPAVEFLWTELATDESGQNAPPPKSNKEELRKLEAERIAQRLRAMLDNGEPLVVEGGKPRPVKPADIVILFRALSNVPLYEAALEAAAIDYYLVGGHAFYSQQEVFDVLNLLRAVSSACDEVSLAGVLRSPFFSLQDESLYWMAERYHSLNAALAAARPPRELKPAEQAKLTAAATTIAELRRLKDIVPPAVLLQTALDLTGYDAVLLAEFLGQRKLANLNKLLEQARAIDQAAGGLDAYLEQLTEFTSRPPHEALAATNPESADVVKLMTIHQAKGLEFPVVIVADLDREQQIRWPSAAFNPNLGPLVKLPETRKGESAVGLDLHQQLHKPEEEAEIVRLFYVACTRAADYLILSSAVKDLDKPSGAWLKLLGEHFDLRTGELLKLAKEYPSLVTVSAPSDAKAPQRSRSSRPDLLKLLAEAELLAHQNNGETPRAAPPILPDRRERQRFTVTRLSGEIKIDDSIVAGEEGTSAENIGGGKWLDPLGLGTLVHAVLERLRFGKPNPVREWCELLAPIHMQKDEQVAAIEAQAMVEQFLNSPRCAELTAAASVKREIEFLLRWPMDSQSADSRYLQGYLDCIYRDRAGNWHLLDFKTNQLAGKNLVGEAEHYRLQLAVYALAMEQALGVRPTELTLHFLRTGQEFTFPWTTPDRTAAITLINEAITALLSPSP